MGGVADHRRPSEKGEMMKGNMTGDGFVDCNLAVANDVYPDHHTQSEILDAA